jgi:hypothetical protein
MYMYAVRKATNTCNLRALIAKLLESMSVIVIKNVAFFESLFIAVEQVMILRN